MIYRSDVVPPSCSGSAEKELFVPAYYDGRLILESSGKINLYEQIQAERQLCDIECLINRFNSGDVDALNRRQGFFGDFTASPDSYRDMLEVVRKGKAFYDSLSDDEKAKFGSFEAFVNADFSSFVNSESVSNVDDLDIGGVDSEQK